LCAIPELLLISALTYGELPNRATPRRTDAVERANVFIFHQSRFPFIDVLGRKDETKKERTNGISQNGLESRGRVSHVCIVNEFAKVTEIEALGIADDQPFHHI
jgi:hypothetical protein